MNARTQHAIQIALLVISLLAIIVLWNSIPETIPTHYNIKGEADSYGSKTSFIWVLPGAMLFVYILISALPYIDPKKYVDQFMSTYRAIGIIVNTFLFMLFIYLLLSWTGHVPAGRSWAPGIAILLMLALGNFFSKLKPNYFIGIRVPWTLENETVWTKTHRMAGYLWVIASLVMLPLYLLLPDNLIEGFFMGYFALIAGVPVIYSFLLFRKMKATETRS